MKELRPNIGEARAMPPPRKSKQLLYALLRDYPGEFVTGFVVDAHLQSYCLTGYIYKSPNHENGERVIAALRERGLGADATLTTLKLAGHHVMLDDPVGFNAAVLAAADS